jgi:hypothetical protein
MQTECFAAPGGTRRRVAAKPLRGGGELARGRARWHGLWRAGGVLLVADGLDHELAVERNGEHSQGGGECPGGDCNGADQQPDGENYESGVH